MGRWDVQTSEGMRWFRISRGEFEPPPLALLLSFYTIPSTTTPVVIILLET